MKNILKKFVILSFIFLFINNVFAEVDTILPVITINGENNISITKGDNYVDAGAVAFDDVDGDISYNIVMINTVDSMTPGVYTVLYNVLDSSNNFALEVTRIVTVLDLPIIPTTLLIDTQVDVSKTCEVSDIDNVNHIYASDSSSSYLGICALKSALDLGSLSNVKLSNQYPDMGLFVIAFDEIEADSNNQYWALYQNSNYAESGLSTLPVLAGDIISFKLSDFSGNETGDSVIIRINSLIQEDEEVTDDEGENGGNSGGEGSIGGNINEKVFSIEDAISFLSLQYEEDESLGGDMYLDWVALSISREGNSSFKSSLTNYIKNKEINYSVITDYERRAMALMSLNINPYDDTEIDYIKKIVDSFDGLQLGEVDLVNDDIFGLIVLQNVGYDENDEIIDKVISYIISKQSNNGSWGSIDMTSAAVMALNNFTNVDEVENTISKAEDYLLENQDDDGGFDNIFSTSWAIQALSNNNSYQDEVENGIQYLANHQNIDGGIDYEGGIANRIWATSYAIPATLKLSWNDILFSFDKEENNLVLEEEILNDEELLVDLPELLVKDEIKEEKIVLNKIIENKKDGSNLVETKILGDNILLASAVGGVMQINENQNILPSPRENLFQKLFGILKRFWLNLLALI